MSKFEEVLESELGTYGISSQRLRQAHNAELAEAVALARAEATRTIAMLLDARGGKIRVSKVIQETINSNDTVTVWDDVLTGERVFTLTQPPQPIGQKGGGRG